VCVCVGGGKGGLWGGGPRSKCVPTKSKCVHTKPKSECVPTSVAQSRQTGSVQNSRGVGGVFVLGGRGARGGGLKFQVCSYKIKMSSYKITMCSCP